MFGNQKLFISHTHEDNQRCQPLLAALDAWQLDYWFDTQELDAGQRFSDRIQQALDARDILLRICTTAAQHSFWMNRELRAVRGLHAAFPQHPRLIVHLVLTPDYVVDAGAQNEVVVDATKSPRAIWLRDLHHALGFDESAPRVSRRAAIGIGALSVAALAATGTATKLLLSPPTTQTGFIPTNPPVTATPQPGAQHVRWQKDFLEGNTSGAVVNDIASDGTQIFSGIGVDVIRAQQAADGKSLWTSENPNTTTIAPFAITTRENVVYVILQDFANLPGNLIFMALDKATGKSLWSVTLNGGFDGTTSHLFAAEVGLFFQSQGKLYGYDLTGKPLWSPVAISQAPSASTFLFSKPVVANGIVYVGSVTGYLFAIDVKTGSQRWRTAITANATTDATVPIFTMPIVANTTVYVGGSDGYCYALNVLTGALRWKQQLLTFSISSPSDSTTAIIGAPAVVNGVLYGAATLTDTVGYFGSGILYALDANSGALIWKNELAKQVDFSITFPSLDPPLLDGALLYITVSLQVLADRLSRQAIIAVQPATGSLQWEYSVYVGGNLNTTGSPQFPSAPVAVQGGVAFLSSAGMLTVLNT